MTIDWHGMMKDISPFLGNFFGQGAGMMQKDNWKNPADAGMGYLQQIPGMAQQQLNPYINAGQNALPGMQNQFNKLLNDPGGRINEIGKSYQESPGLQSAIQKALRASGNAASAGGYAGSPMHETYNMEQATNLANQDYNNWLGSALGEYNQGIAGSQNIYGTGANASNSLSQMLAQALAGQGQLAYGGQAMNNEHEANMAKQNGSFFDSIGKIAGAALPFFI